MYPHVFDFKVFTVYSPSFCLHCPDEFKDYDERVPWVLMVNIWFPFASVVHTQTQMDYTNIIKDK